jgi:hypothetical protein
MCPDERRPNRCEPREYPQRAVGVVRVIQMQAQCEHLLQRFNRRLNMWDAILYLHGPKPETSAHERRASVKS